MIVRRLDRAAAMGALVLSACTAGAQAPAFQPRPCPPGLGDARCGTVEVPENHERPDGRRISLNVVVLPARTATPAREAVTFFGGGPGQAVTPMARMLSRSPMDALRDQRDLLLVDQRGTGGSAPLQCALRDPANPQSYLDDFLPAAAAARCREELERRADLARYGLPELAHDLEAVRRALGYQRLDLRGGSYGTRAALVYMRAYPRSVRTAALHGVVPIGSAPPRDHARNTEAALAGLLAECRADAACAAAFPGAEAELREVMRRLDTAPATVEIADPDTGERIRLTLSRDTFGETIRRMLYDPAEARAIPLAVHRAYRGDFRQIAAQTLRDRRAMQEGAWWGLYLALTCREDIPFIDTVAAARESAGTLLGGYRLRQHVAACRGWPRGNLPAGYHQPRRMDVPTLLISGTLDPATPPRDAETTASTLPNSVHLVVPGGAHWSGGMEGGGCIDALVVRFIRQGHARGLDVEGCAARIRRPPFLLPD